MTGTVALRGPSGNVWSVGLVANGDMLLLKHGWIAFVEDHSLEENDILIFKYNGNSSFDVFMFDQESLCEKATSYFVKKCVHTESARGNKLGEAWRNVLIRPINPQMMLLVIRVKKPRSDAAERHLQEYSPVDLLQGVLKSRRREVTEEEQMFVATSSENSFIVSIPSEWAKVYLQNRSHDIELRVKDNAWKAKYHYKGYGGGLTGGWKDFILENFLEEFDVCLFNLVRGTKDTVILDVEIFRVSWRR
ncbi:B3 domain-containing protein REM16 [Sesamum alatum]|uniref:B3 domain-containing protein REM16 n=1 Tax=Sesamum alatum TaxID=300844 RepID=A0AAE2CNV8_9LAMI|nr:B3 domain-containing protein REM16 [Sesamum alatum]